jgi:lysyl-tRNA synthetase class 1
MKNASDLPDAWPFVEASRVVARMAKLNKSEAVFETGFGPSGMPHVGTFAEVVRTSWVRNAFKEISDIPTRLISYSDDMDGMRRVPQNVPNQERTARYLGMPLCRIPDPYGQYESLSAHAEARLRAMLDDLGLDYEFKKASDSYRDGLLDQAMLAVLAHHQEIVNVVTPTLGAERSSHWSPFMPIHPINGQVMQVGITPNPDAKTVIWQDHDGKSYETSVLGGACKLQWKADWAARWLALGVDYEMCGKDLLDSVKLSSKIVRILGGLPPENMIYEMFLDKNGQKFSKSKGNAFGVEDWLRYGPSEALSHVFFRKPGTAKALKLDDIPRNIDEWLGDIKASRSQDGNILRQNPAWHVHNAKMPNSPEVSYALLVNVASASEVKTGAELASIIGITAKEPVMDRFLDYVVNFCHDVVSPNRVFHEPVGFERDALLELVEELKAFDDTSEAEAIQARVYEVGKHYPFANLRDWFSLLYRSLLGVESGPRFGNFVALRGVQETITMITDTLNRSPVEETYLGR